LYFEMIVIRWLASDIRVFAYFKNFPLLAAFLGLGIGCARARGSLFTLFPALCLVFGIIVAFSEPLALVHLHIPQRDDTLFWNAVPVGETLPVWLLGPVFNERV
jgi:hypothetical protein